MTTDNVLLLIVAILAMVAMAAGMTYWSRRNYDELRRVVAASDEAMRQAAGSLGLEFVQQGSYEHPIVGTIPTFGFVRGVLDGVRVHARVEQDSDGYSARTELSAESPTGKELLLHPKVKKTGSSLFIVYEIVTDPAALGSHLRELAGQARQAQ